MSKDRVVITGMGALSALGATTHELWNGLLQNRSGVRRVKRLVDSGITVTSGGEVDAVSLDEMLADRSPTFVKMDIEGAEPSAIAGATVTLREKAPALAICLYHRRDHLWTLPLAIRTANPTYHFHLRRYSDDCWETVCYAVGPQRVAPAQRG